MYWIMSMVVVPMISMGGIAYLRTTSSVLSGTARNQLGVPLHELLVETHVLVLGEDGIVVLQAILLEQSGITRLNQHLNVLLEWIGVYPRA